MSSKRLAIFSSAVVVSVVLGLGSISRPVKAQGCPCNYMAWYMAAEIMLPPISAATNAAFEALFQAQEALSQAISSGLDLHKERIDSMEESIVAAVEVHGQVVAAKEQQSSVAETKYYQALRGSMETLAKTKAIAKNNRRVATQRGAQSISHLSNTLATMQTAKIEPDNAENDANEDSGDNEGGEPRQATVHELRKIVAKRKQRYAEKILKNEVSSGDFLEVAVTMQAQDAAPPGYDKTIIEKKQLPFALSARRFSVLPPGVHGGLPDAALDGPNRSRYREVVQRVRTAGQFMAWDLALRSEIVTDQRSTSLMAFVERAVRESYHSKESKKKATGGYSRELMQTVAAGQSLSNLLDMLLLEVESHQVRLEAAKIGHYNAEAFHPVSGRVPLDFIDESIER